jgi:hypothetical protein
MSDELAILVASTLAAKGAEAWVSGGKTAFGALVRFVRSRVGVNTRDAEVVDRAMAHPDDRDAVVELTGLLARVMSADQVFGREVEGWWRRSLAEWSIDHDGVVNEFSGMAQQVVQARDIGGDVRF